MKKTHEEYMRIARILGEHLGIELHVQPVDQFLTILFHFIRNPDCPLCLDRFAGKK
jgi:hypothetical protein